MQYTKRFKFVQNSLNALIIVLLVLAIIPVTPAYAATFTVTKTDDTNDGSCDADCSLREAIVAANATAGADTIILNNSTTYDLTLAGGGNLGDLDVSGVLTIQSNDPNASPAIINAVVGTLNNRILDVAANANITLRGVTLQGGRITTGGAINIGSNATVTLDRVTLTNNQATSTATCGGAIFISAGSTLNINESTINDNQCTTNGGDGGAIGMINGTVNIRNSTFYGNQVSTLTGAAGNNSQGGAIYIGGGTLTADFVSFSANRAQADQGADIQQAGGIFNISHSFLVNPVNTTINCYSSTAGGTTTDTLIENNAAGGNACGTAPSTAFSDALTLADNGGPTQTLAITAAMTDLYNAASSCTGSNNTDQRGIARPQGAACDRGAFELVPNSLPTVTTQAVTGIGTTTATGNGTITALGVPDPTAYGVVWNTTGTPTTADSVTNEGAASATGTFASSMSGLVPNTTYYVRAYATNAAGTSYGNEVSFNTTANGGVVETAKNLPATGFPKGRITAIPIQPLEKAYVSTDMVLEIPSLDKELTIVGVPKSADGWDVSWLGDNVGYLAGSAFPTWTGNTVVTGHVWDAYNNPGPFVHLRNLRYGDQIKIHAWGQVYTYEVRESKLITSNNVKTVFKHEDLDWLTLLSCEFYNPISGNYLFRRMVRAVLISVR